MHTGEVKTPGGRGGDVAAVGLSQSLRSLGFELQRFKTGTPPRLNGRTIDFARLEPQPGDAEPVAVLVPDRRDRRSRSSTATSPTPTPRSTTLIRANLHRAPMYSGQIQSTGPRYCPSIEDKVVRFADREQHQIFLEPEGRNTLEYYCNGISTSLPRDVQEAIIPHDPGPRARRDHAVRLRGRIRLRPADAAPRRRSRPSRSQASSSPARSTARPATRRRPPRA